MTTNAAGATSHLPALLRTAEDELQKLRGQLAAVAAFIHDPAHDLDARSHLARLLTLPQPAPANRPVPATERHDIPSPRPPSTTQHTPPPSRKDPAHEHALHR
ncbi:hypothetical protein J8N05_47145 (plasmid) [Streptomyces sp. BH-SS-21]|uniref:Uncharacterized protein n=1 Tax=Streptomyces liliiviolaceus TaxID=2823109 RepID=A0A940Y1U8_9ACTN|nr:hypothetical protein [Streptomyces liliiviolaceus]MBQ0855739.1 hypothetical protein [Streptomyces liliiviolaceus]